MNPASPSHYMSASSLRLLPSKAAHNPETSELNIAHLKVTLIILVNANFDMAIYFAWNCATTTLSVLEVNVTWTMPIFFVGVTVSSKLTDCSYVLIWSYFDISYDLLRALYLGFPLGCCKHADKTNAVYFHLNAGVLPLSQDDCPVYTKILFLLNSFGKYVGMHV